MKTEFKSKKTINTSIFKTYKSDCINCKKCVNICPFLQEYIKSPKSFINDLENSSIDINLPYYCSLCSCCKRVCPKDIDLGQLFFLLREEITTTNNGKTPIKGHKAMDFHQNFSNNTIFKGVYGKKNTKKFFMPGCSLNGYSPNLSLKTYNYLKEKLGDVGLILNCCNKPTKDLGKRDLFDKRFSQFISSLKKFNNDDIEIITACQSCFRVLKDETKDIKITSLWSLFSEIGIPKNSIGKGLGSNLTFSIKDSCQGLDYKEIGDGIRYVVESLGYNLNSKDVTNNCCGLGGIVHLSNPLLSKKTKDNCINSLNSDNVITYCGGCLSAINNSDKNSYHILELIFEDEDTLFVDRKVNISALSSWKNRYKIKKDLVKEDSHLEKK